MLSVCLSFFSVMILAQSICTIFFLEFGIFTGETSGQARRSAVFTVSLIVLIDVA